MADLTQIESLRWRNIGPFRGGRSVAVAGHPTDSPVFYFGSTGGGVWKTTNGGTTWRNVTDGYVNSSSVGAIAVAASDPNVLYVGMGESCIRGNVTFGDGVYKSTDGGETWGHLGLEATRHIARVRVHPTNPDVVYVAALGHAFGPNPERGIYRSKDGGKTWEPILQVSDRTGAIDLSMDPLNPRILYAAMWQAQRSPWGFESGGPESGLYRSPDGGDTWQRLGEENGLPTGVVGRIGIAASGALEGRVYAMVESAEGGLFRSENGGRTWTLATDAREPRSRPWYYSHVFADPVDPDTVYILSAGFYRSIDGGRNFDRVATPHGDHHDLWIDPANPRRMIHGADGGAAVSFDGAKTWSSIHNQPTSEFYHVTTDSRYPYRVYGAQQDNSTITVQSASRYVGMDRREWYEVGGAESGYIAVRKDNPDIVYAGSSGGGEGGRLTRYDHATGQLRDISVWPEKTAGVAAEAYTYRFQWTSPIALGVHDADAIYMCGNRVFRSTDEGQNWKAISPDLTRNDPEKLRPAGGPITLDQTGVEIYCTVFAFAESPVEKGLLWAGSDDGLLHVTHDDGASWQNVTPPELPEWTLVSIIEPGHRDGAVAYVAAHRYKLDDPRPFLFKTSDGGKTWTSITVGIPKDEYTRVIREDPEVPGLLYAGTERGVYVSFDDGGKWQPLRLNMPLVPVHDIEVHGTDLVIASHGRSFWILDDLTPVRTLARDPGAPGALRLFPPRETVRSSVGAGGFFGRLPDEIPYPMMVADHYLSERPKTGDAPIFLDAGQNQPPGAILQYYVAEEPKGALTLTIRDADGAQVVRFTSEKSEEKGAPKPISKAKGSHRLVWDLRYPGATRVEGAKTEWPTCAPLAPPGAYEITLEADGVGSRQTLHLVRAPDVRTSPAEFAEQFALLVRIRDQVSAIHEGVNTAQRALDEVASWERRARGTARETEVKEAAHGLRESLEEVRNSLIQHQVTNFQDEINFPPKLNSQVAHLFRVASSADAKPTSQTYEAFAELEGRAREVLGRLRDLIDHGFPAFADKMTELEVPALRI